MTDRSKRSLRLIAAAALAFGLVACGGGGNGGNGGDGTGGSGGGGKTGTGEPGGKGGTTALAEVCPETVVIQTNWWPQAEYGALYNLFDAESVDDDRLEVDSGGKGVTGPLVDDGEDTGVRVELRSGGPANSFTPSISVLYTDDEVMLGGADLDQVMRFQVDQPVTAVFAPMDLSPVLLMWDPETYPQISSIQDIGETDATVLYFQGSTYMDYLVGSGVLKQSQVDPSYDGTPARFVAEDGKAIQQGFLTNEIYQYEHELPEWDRPLDYALVADAGYPVYPETLVARSDDLEQLGPCLEQLVPALQRSTVDYAADPTATNELMSQLVQEFDAFPYSTERAAAAVELMQDEGVLGNGENDTIGDFDADRVAELLDVVTPIFAEQQVPVSEDLVPEDVFTNEYIEEGTGL